jgi:hypothetical protein
MSNRLVANRSPFHIEIVSFPTDGSSARRGGIHSDALCNTALPFDHILVSKNYAKMSGCHFTILPNDCNISFVFRKTIIDPIEVARMKFNLHQDGMHKLSKNLRIDKYGCLLEYDFVLDHIPSGKYDVILLDIGLKHHHL